MVTLGVIGHMCSHSHKLWVTEFLLVVHWLWVIMVINVGDCRGKRAVTNRSGDYLCQESYVLRVLRFMR